MNTRTDSTNNIRRPWARVLAHREAQFWTLQFVGHAVERTPPEFFKDWRFLFVGLRWWIAKLRGRG